MDVTSVKDRDLIQRAVWTALENRLIQKELSTLSTILEEISDVEAVDSALGAEKGICLESEFGEVAEEVIRELEALARSLEESDQGCGRVSEEIVSSLSSELELLRKSVDQESIQVDEIPEREISGGLEAIRLSSISETDSCDSPRSPRSREDLEHCLQQLRQELQAVSSILESHRRDALAETSALEQLIEDLRTSLKGNKLQLEPLREEVQSLYAAAVDARASREDVQVEYSSLLSESVRRERMLRNDVQTKRMQVNALVREIEVVRRSQEVAAARHIVEMKELNDRIADVTQEQRPKS